MRIYLLKLRVSNAYLLVGNRPILIDTGSPGDIELIRAKLRALDIEFSDLALIAHTHVHSDHIGSTVQIAAEAKCPIAYHPADHEIAARAHNGLLKGVGIRGKVMSRFFSHSKFTSATADLELHDAMSLENFGTSVTVVATPGHTAGSISFVTQSGDAVIGDVLMGGYMGGILLPNKPNHHYFADDVNQAMSSLDVILARTAGKLYVGHGGPLTQAAVNAWRGRQKQGW
jgi:hydroxyacylglutathione hydrolase